MFTFNTARSLVFGSGALDRLGQLVAGWGVRGVLIVTDEGLVAAGLAGRAATSLAAAGLAVETYSGVVADPPESVVLAAAEAARAAGVGAVIGFGGGSSLDAAKLAAALAAGAQPLSEMYGVGNLRGGRLPLALVPTTAGTGSEVTPISIVTTGAHEKMGVVSPVLLPDLALLDPDLTLGVPPAVTAATGIDAMVHAIEAFASASPNNNPMSRTLAREALRLMGGALVAAVDDGSNRAARADMLLGAMLAGQAFANSPVAAVHALAYPIGGYFGVPHGLSNALVLPHVLRFNAGNGGGLYAEIAPDAFPALGALPPAQRDLAFAEALSALSARCGLPVRLRDVGVPEEALDRMAAAAMRQTRLLVNNPRALTESDARAIYAAAH